MKLILIILLSILLFSCNEPLGLEENYRETISYRSIIPLAVGNQWLYRITEYDQNIVDPINVFHRRIEITARHELNGEFWYRVHDDFEKYDYFYSYRADGLYIKIGDINSQERLYFQYPTQVGNEYTLHQPTIIDNEVLHTFRKVMGFGVEASSPYGTFPAIRYDDDYRYDAQSIAFDPINVFLFNHEVGLVRAHINDVRDDYSGIYLKYAVELENINF